MGCTCNSENDTSLWNKCHGKDLKFQRTNSEKGNKAQNKLEGVVPVRAPLSPDRKSILAERCVLSAPQNNFKIIFKCA